MPAPRISSPPTKRTPTHLRLESEHAEYRRRRHLDIDSVTMILELEISHFVDEQSLERGVKERDRLEPLQVPRQLVAIDEQPGEEQTATTTDQLRISTSTTTTHLNSIIRLPTRLAMPAFLMRTLRRRTALEAVKLKRMRTRMNRQNESSVGTSPTGE